MPPSAPRRVPDMTKKYFQFLLNCVFLTVSFLAADFEDKGVGPVVQTDEMEGVVLVAEAIHLAAFAALVDCYHRPLHLDADFHIVQVARNFSGMVGSYSFNADFDRTNLKVGEAMTLTINIKGDGLPGSITDPKLPDFGEFRSVPPENEINKKIVGNKVITTKNIRVFLYPKKKGEFTIPEITYSWFNPSKKAYETAKAGPWNVVVEKGDASAEAIFQAPVAQGPAAVQKQEIESLGSDIRFIHKVRESANSTAPYKSILYWVLFAAAIPFYLIVTFAVRSRRKHNSDAALVRKGKANKMLKARFANAREALKKGNAKALYAALENGLINYLSDKTNLEFKGMTRPQMKEELAKLGVKSETIAAIDNWLEKCAFARFAPVNPTKDEQQKMLEDVEKLCEELK